MFFIMNIFTIKAADITPSGTEPRKLTQSKFVGFLKQIFYQIFVYI